MGDDMKRDDLTKEFDDFVYIISHDMAAPQRHIREFTKLLLSTLGEQGLTPEQVLYKGFIEQGLVKLERMQSALLDLSRIATQGDEFSRLDSLECIRGAFSKVDRKIKDSGALITLPETSYHLYGDEKQIVALFVALLDNALTYVHEGVLPVIDIKAYEEAGVVIFDIQDKGLGIPLSRSEDIFTMFRRLHAPDAYNSGMGAGLAIARKIARRHGGDIALIPQNEGSLFRLTLPAGIPQKS